MRKPEQIAVVGVTGYTGFELARILVRHPAVNSPVFYVRETQGKKCLAELFPQLRGVGKAPPRCCKLASALSISAAPSVFAPRIPLRPGTSSPLPTQAGSAKRSTVFPSCTLLKSPPRALLPIPAA